MKLSNKKIKYIRRHASQKSSEAIAKDLHIRVRDVQIVLGQSADRMSYKAISTLDGIFHWGLVAISFLAPFMFLRDIYDFANLPQTVFIQIGVVFLFFIWLIKGLLSKKCLIIKSPFNLPIFAFVLWAFISIIYAHNKYEGFLLWLHWTASILMFFLVINDVHDNKRLIRLLIAISISGSLCALLGIAQYLFGLSWVPQAIPPAATFANKNMAVHFIILAIPLVVGLLFSVKRNISRLLLFLPPLIMITFLVCAKARAGFVALAVESIFLAAMLIRVGKRKIAVCLVTVGLAITILMSHVAYKNFNIESVELRMAIWQNTFEMIKEKPLIGLGLGNHKIFYPLYTRKVVIDRWFSEGAQLSKVHNDFIQVFAELGVVGMLLLGCIGIVLMKVTWSLTSSRYSQDVRFWSIGITVGIIGLLVIASFSFPFQRAIPPFIIMILIGILCSFYLGDNRGFYSISQRWTILFACILVLFGLIYLIRFHYLGIKCDRHYLNMFQMEKSGNWQGVITEGEKAYRYNPSRAKVMSSMGRAYLEMGELHKGIDALKKVLAAYPNNITALFNIGLAYDNIGDNKSALEAYEKLLLIKPDYSKVHNNMANIYMKQNNLDRALQELKLAAKFDPQNSVIYINIGIVEIQMKRYQEAVKSFERATRLDAGWGLTRKDLFQKNKKKVVEYLKKALELNPRNRNTAQIRKLIDLMERIPK